MYNRMFGGRRVWFATLLVAAIALTPGVAAGQEAPATPEAVERSVGDMVLDERFTRPLEDVSLPGIPRDPVGALVTATNARSASLGFRVDHGPAIRRSGMSKEFAGRLALLMRAANSCPALVEGDKEVTREQLDCAAAVNDAAAGVARVKEGSSGDVQAWPALYIDGDGGKDFYVHDYSVLIDTGGDDTYDNNAGGNLLDHIRGPEGSAAPVKGKAIGCEHPHIVPPIPGTVPAPFDCIADRQTVLIDQEGNDTYGVFKPPRKRDDNPLPPELHRMSDADCTNDPVIRRIMTEGAALQGNALFIDEGGNDRYRGKTGAQGTGHVGGIGILRDLGGSTDDYLAIRNSQGFALVSGLGVLQDDGGNDRYHTYMPRPSDRNAESGEPGSGGVVDDTDRCDNLPRMVQGAGLGGFGFPGAMGRLLDEDGQDVYKGEPPANQLFLEPGIVLTHSSQGFGCDGSVGILEDEGSDRDEYRRGPEGRKDGAQIFDPNIPCESTFPAPGVGIFEDDGPNRR